MKKVIKKSTYDWVIECLAFICLLWALYPLLHYASLPSQVPMHYNLHGEVDGWGGRGHFLAMAIIAMVLYVGLSWAAKFYRIFNYPTKVTQENKDRLYRIALSMVRHMKLLTVAIFAYINHTSFSIATGGIGMNMWIMSGFIVGVFAVIFIFIYKIYKAR